MAWIEFLTWQGEGVVCEFLRIEAFYRAEVWHEHAHPWVITSEKGWQVQWTAWNNIDRSGAQFICLFLLLSSQVEQIELRSQLRWSARSSTVSVSDPYSVDLTLYVDTLRQDLEATKTSDFSPVRQRRQNLRHDDNEKRSAVWMHPDRVAPFHLGPRRGKANNSTSSHTRRRTFLTSDWN